MSTAVEADELVDAETAAALTGMGLQTTRNYVSRGVFGPRVHNGRHVYVYRSQVEAYKPTGRRRTVWKAHNVAEDVEWLLRAGEEADAIRRRLGYTSWQSLERLLNRNGYGDLVDRVIAWTAERGHTSSGGDISRTERY